MQSRVRIHNLYEAWKERVTTKNADERVQLLQVGEHDFAEQLFPTAREPPDTHERARAEGGRVIELINDMLGDFYGDSGSHEGSSEIHTWIGSRRAGMRVEVEVDGWKPQSMYMW